MEEKKIIISANTADLCQKLVDIEIQKYKTLNTCNKRLKTRLEMAKNELKGNYIDITNLKELLKRIKEYDRCCGFTD